MSTTEHTPEAVRAAEVIDFQIARQGDYTIEDMAAIIDQETGLPTLQSRIDCLEAENTEINESWETEIIHANKIINNLEAEKAELVEALRELHDVQNGPPLVKYENEWYAAIDKTRTALSKYEQTNPKPEE